MYAKYYSSVITVREKKKVKQTLRLHTRKNSSQDRFEHFSSFFSQVPPCESRLGPSDFEDRLEQLTARYEERIIELHSVIAELRKKVERHQISVIRSGIVETFQQFLPPPSLSLPLYMYFFLFVSLSSE